MDEDMRQAFRGMCDNVFGDSRTNTTVTDEMHAKFRAVMRDKTAEESSDLVLASVVLNAHALNATEAAESERDAARADHRAAEQCLGILVRAWEALDPQTQATVAVHAPGVRRAMELVRGGRPGRWWETT